MSTQKSESKQQTRGDTMRGWERGAGGKTVRAKSTAKQTEKREEASRGQRKSGRRQENGKYVRSVRV